jgi:hypothetical protein
VDLEALAAGAAALQELLFDVGHARRRRQGRDRILRRDGGATASSGGISSKRRCCEDRSSGADYCFGTSNDRHFTYYLAPSFQYISVLYAKLAHPFAIQ